MFCLGNGLSRPQMQLILFLGVMEKLCQKSSLGSHPSLPEPHFSGHLWKYLIQRRGIKKWEGKRSRLHQRPTPGEQKVCLLTIPIPITRPWRPFLLFKSKSIFSKPYMKTESESGSVVTLCDPMDCSNAWLPCPSLSPRVWSNLCLLGWWCHPNTSSSDASFFWPPSLPASGSFWMSQFFTWDAQNIRASASASVLPMNIKDWFLLRLTALISLMSKGLSRVFSNTLL